MAIDQFMQMALDQAKKADPACVRPNPLVGAVVVTASGEIAGKGYHVRCGEAHAEVNAIDDALRHGADLSRCTLFVTLEPCSHQGRTPPCTHLIISHGIKKVVIGSMDPNPVVRGKEMLEEAGIEVILEAHPEMVNLNKVFFTNKIHNRPFVVVKSAMTLNGKIADRTGESKWISNEKSRSHVHDVLRSDADAILTTARTIIKDDAKFNIRKSDGSLQDKPVIVLDRDFDLLSKANSSLSLFASHPNSIIEVVGATLPQDHAHHDRLRLHTAGFLPNGTVEMTAFLEQLLQLNYCSILVEAGGKLASALLKENLIDELYLYVAPIIIADDDALSLFSSSTPMALAEAKKMTLDGLQQLDDNVLLKYIRP